jgi:hypothetical protein
MVEFKWSRAKFWAKQTSALSYVLSQISDEVARRLRRTLEDTYDEFAASWRSLHYSSNQMSNSRLS